MGAVGRNLLKLGIWQTLPAFMSTSILPARPPPSKVPPEKQCPWGHSEWIPGLLHWVGGPQGWGISRAPQVHPSWTGPLFLAFSLGSSAFVPHTPTPWAQLNPSLLPSGLAFTSSLGHPCPLSSIRSRVPLTTVARAFTEIEGGVCTLEKTPVSLSTRRLPWGPLPCLQRAAVVNISLNSTSVRVFPAKASLLCSNPVPHAPATPTRNSRDLVLSAPFNSHLPHRT